MPGAELAFNGNDPDKARRIKQRLGRGEHTHIREARPIARNRHQILTCTNGERTVKSWEIIADNLSKAGWSWGCVSAIDSDGRTIWIVDAHRDDGKRFVVHAEEKVTAMLELERAVCIHLLTEQI
jgi:hypothetical protein